MPAPEGCLILKCPKPIDHETQALLQRYLAPIAERMGAQALVLGDGIDVAYAPPGFGDLVKALTAQTEALNSLAASNEALAQSVQTLIAAMAEADGMDPADGPGYMDTPG